LTRDNLTAIKIPAIDIAKKLGSERVVNMVMLGAFVAHTKITSLDSIMNGLSEIVKGGKNRHNEIESQGSGRRR